MSRAVSRLAPMRWPNNARIAVLPQLGLEAFAGDHIEPSPIGLPPKGVTNINGKAWVDYGGRVGAWRVLELFRRHQLPATTLMSALAVERWPILQRHGSPRAMRSPGTPMHKIRACTR